MLELEITPGPSVHDRVTTTACWHPAGAVGMLYWYALGSAHGLIFGGRTREICRRAEEGEGAAGGQAPASGPMP